MIKILVIGNSNAGKTQFLNRFTNNKFDHDYKATIVSEFSMKILQIDGAEIRLQMWDLQGQDRVLGTMTR